MRPDLEQGLREQLRERVELRYATTLTQIDQHTHGVHVGLSDGTTLDADLLVGADGIHSTVRGMAFGEEQRYLRYLGFHTAAFLFDAPDLRAEIGNRFCLTDTVNQVMGCYGLRDGRVAAFTVHRTPDRALPEDAQAAVRREYRSLGWIVPTALDRCPPTERVYYDQVAQIEMPGWSRGRVTLVGDACQAVSLLAGQGASLGIAGAYVLAEHVTRADSIEDGLARYEQMWRPVVAEKQQVARKGARWFLPESQTQLRVRRAAMKLARIPGIDRFVAGAVTGKSIAVVRQLHATGRDLNRTTTP
jgi:2-polyprenyl-6-methoxyphenol hydroxylase-like FAD-dependent oxidoreductase